MSKFDLSIAFITESYWRAGYLQIRTAVRVSSRVLETFQLARLRSTPKTQQRTLATPIISLASVLCPRPQSSRTGTGHRTIMAPIQLST